MTEHIVDPLVSRQKFEREVKQFNELKDYYAQKGWWLLKAEFPEVFVVFASPKTQPYVVLFGALMDFTNYDLWPPSVKLVNPFTRVPYKMKELPTLLVRGIPLQTNIGILNATDKATKTNPTLPTTVSQQIAPQPLMQAFGPDEIPFICLPGVREYHQNPAHTGDSWLLHRGNGEGTLYFLIEQLSRYGLEPVKQLNFQIEMKEVKIHFQGFVVDIPT